MGRWRMYFCLCVQSQAVLCLDSHCGIARASGCMDPLEPSLPLGTNQLCNFDLCYLGSRDSLKGISSVAKVSLSKQRQWVTASLGNARLAGSVSFWSFLGS